MASAASNTFAAAILQPVAMPELARIDARPLAPGNYVKGTVLGMVSTLTAQNDVKTVTVGGTATGGTYILVLGAYQTTALAFNANNATIQAALEAMPNIGVGNVVVGGGALPGTPATLTFQGKLAAREIPSMTTINSLTGTTPTIAVANTTPGRTVGGIMKPYNNSNTDGSQTAVAICQMDGIVDTFGNHIFGGGDLGTTGQMTAPVFVRGCFKTKELVGLDSAAVAELGRIIKGDVGSLTNDATWLLIA